MPTQPIQIDTLLKLQTPEGVLLEVRPAGPLVRGVAWLVDVIIRFALYVWFASAISTIGEAGFGFFLIFIFFIEWLYPSLLEMLFNGATLGKKLVGIKVVRTNGTPVDWRSSLTRNLLWPVDFLPGFYAIGLISCLISGQFQRVGDIAAGTLVVYRAKKTKPLSHMDFPQTAVAPTLPITPDEQQVIIDFAYRSMRLTNERANELAALTSPLISTTDATPAKDQLLKIANFLIGKKE